MPFGEMPRPPPTRAVEEESVLRERGVELDGGEVEGDVGWGRCDS